jgi:hypothetical protein
VSCVVSCRIVSCGVACVSVSVQKRASSIDRKSARDAGFGSSTSREWRWRHPVATPVSRIRGYLPMCLSVMSSLISVSMHLFVCVKVDVCVNGISLSRARV